MKSTQVVNKSTSDAMVSRALREGTSVLMDELLLAFHWGRPSILVAVQNTKAGLVRAAEALERSLGEQSIQVVHVQPAQVHTDLINWIRTFSQEKPVVFFLESMGLSADVYHTLNVHREMFVERSIRIVFWLTQKESANLPRYAPDFWAFRHRVVEFASTHKQGWGAPPAGLLMWDMGLQLTDLGSINNNIKFLQDLLNQLPNEDGYYHQRTELSLELSRGYFLTGQYDRAWDLITEIWSDASVINDSQMIIHILNAQAIINYVKKRYLDAKLCLDKALILNLSTEMLLANLGIVYSAMGKRSRAISMIKRALRINRNSSWLWSIDGYIHIFAGKLEHALDAFSEAVEVDHTNFYASFGLAYVNLKLHQLGRLDDLLHSIEHDFAPLHVIYSVCVDGLRGNLQGGLEHLRSVLNGSIPYEYLEQDPALRIVFSRNDLQPLVETV